MDAYMDDDHETFAAAWGMHALLPSAVIGRPSGLVASCRIASRHDIVLEGWLYSERHGRFIRERRFLRRRRDLPTKQGFVYLVGKNRMSSIVYAYRTRLEVSPSKRVWCNPMQFDATNHLCRLDSIHSTSMLLAIGRGDRFLSFSQE